MMKNNSPQWKDDHKKDYNSLKLYYLKEFILYFINKFMKNDGDGNNDDHEWWWKILWYFLIDKISFLKYRICITLKWYII
jgi:hypothetical protein